MDEEIAAIKETAKAVQEVAKTGGKLVDAGVRTGGWLDKIFGEPIGQTVAHVWTDRIKARRIEAAIYDWERYETLIAKTKQRLQAMGVIEIRSVPPKVALPLLEHATMEHEDELHTLWANLLATGMDGREDEIQRKYVSTLAEMTAEDALVLSWMFGEAKTEIAKKETRVSTLTYGPGVDGTHTYNTISVITLNRLGLIEPAYVKFTTYEPGGHDDRFGDYGPSQEEVCFPGNLESVVITPFGIAFGKAVGLDGAD
jgi:hypothetical protein